MDALRAIHPDVSCHRLQATDNSELPYSAP